MSWLRNSTGLAIICGSFTYMDLRAGKSIRERVRAPMTMSVGALRHGSEIIWDFARLRMEKMFFSQSTAVSPATIRFTAHGRWRALRMERLPCILFWWIFLRVQRRSCRLHRSLRKLMRISRNLRLHAFLMNRRFVKSSRITKKRGLSVPERKVNWSIIVWHRVVWWRNVWQKAYRWKVRQGILWKELRSIWIC